MAKNLRRGSKVYVLSSGYRSIPGVVIKKFTARKGSVSVPNKQRTLVHVRASNQLFVKRPSELRRRA